MNRRALFKLLAALPLIGRIPAVRARANLGWDYALDPAHDIQVYRDALTMTHVEKLKLWHTMGLDDGR